MAKPMFDPSTVHHANLAQLAAVVPGAVVSRPLVDAGGVKVVLFAMDAGQDIREHRAPYVATVHVLYGRLRFGVGGERRTMGPHDWIVMPADAPHDLLAEEPTAFLLTLVKP